MKLSKKLLMIMMIIVSISFAGCDLLFQGGGDPDPEPEPETYDLPLFADDAITYYLDGETAAGTEMAMIAAWEGSATVAIDTDEIGSAEFVSYPSWWGGGVAWMQTPDSADGFYDLSGVDEIKFDIKSATIEPSELEYMVQWLGTANNGGEFGITLEDLGITDITDWTTVTVDLATDIPDDSSQTGRYGKDPVSFVTGNGNQYVDTSIAIRWDGIASIGGDGTVTGSLVAGDAYELSNIRFLDGTGAEVDIVDAIAYNQPIAAPAEPASVDIGLYTDVTPTTAVALNWANWSTAEGTALDFSGNNVKALATTFTGYDVVPAMDLSAKTTLHMQVWTAGHTAVKIKIVDFKGDGWTAGGDTEYEHEAAIASTGQWVQLDIPLTTWSSQMENFTDINQIVLTGVDGNATGAGSYYIDNFYID